MKRILIISYFDYPSWVGLSNRISGLSEVLSKNGIKVKIIAPIARYDKPFSKKPSKKIDVQHIDLRRFGFDNDSFLCRFIQLLLFSILSSIIVFREYVTNHCLIQFQSVFSAFPALLAKLVLRAKIIGDDIVLIHPFIDLPILRFSDIVCTPSWRTCQLVGKSEKIVYLPNGTSAKDFDKKKPLTKSHKTILFVGSLSFDQNLKAVENIFKIASKLHEKKLQFSFLIVGGPLSFAKHLMAHSLVETGLIKFLGRVSDQRLTQLYQGSDFGILPFFKDTPLVGGQRTKAIQYFANNLFVVSGPEGIKGINGLVPGIHFLQSNTVNEMSEVLADCLSHCVQFESIRQNGRNLIRKDYSWANLSKDYLRIIMKLS